MRAMDFLGDEGRENMHGAVGRWDGSVGSTKHGPTFFHYCQFRLTQVTSSAHRSSSADNPRMWTANLHKIVDGPHGGNHFKDIKNFKQRLSP